MDSDSAIAALGALAQGTRLDAFRLLVRHEPDGLAAGEVARALDVPQNTMSVHLATLARAGLIHAERRSRIINYRVDLDQLKALTLFLVKDCCGGKAELCEPLIAELVPLLLMEPIMSDRIFNVIFLCTGNSARSILAESALNKQGDGRFRAFSAGSFPKGAVNPDAIAVLERIEYPTEGPRSKSWEEFSGADAPVMDFVFTVCDDAAGETCPVWLGHPMTAHWWGIEDPSHVQGTPVERERAFVTALRYLENRIKLFIALPFDRLDAMALRAHVREIGHGEGASGRRGDAA